MNETANETCVSQPKLNIELLGTNIAFVLFGILAFVGNCLIILLIGKYNSLCKKYEFIYFVLSLAFADGISGLGSTVAGIDRIRLQMMNAAFNKAECIGTTLILIAGMISSQLLILCVAGDRLSALISPMSYKVRNHFKAAMICSLITFVYVIISVSAMFVNVDLSEVPPVCNAGASWTYAYRVHWFVFNITVGSGVIVMSLVGLIVLKRQLHVVGTSQSALADQVRRQAKGSQAIGLVLIGYFCSYVVPNGIYSSAGFLGFGGKTLGRLGPYIGIGAGISSSNNIFIYSWRLKYFRVVFMKFLRCQSDGAVAAGNTYSRAPTRPWTRNVSQQAERPQDGRRENLM